MPGGADDMDQARIGGELGKHQGRRRNGEFDQGIGLPHQRRGVGGDAHSVFTEPGQFAGVAADHGGVRRIDRTGKRDALAAKMIALLEGAEFNGQPFSTGQADPLISQGQDLLDEVNSL